MARHGLNCTLSYSDGKVLHSYRVRVDQAAHGVVMVAEESQARTVRAFYPHRVAEDQFSINVMLKGTAERISFVRWLHGYTSFVLSTDLPVGRFPPMLVNLPSRDFLHSGVPLTGVEYGDHVGSMVWNHMVAFEAVPLAMKIKDVSSFVPATQDPKATPYFYPLGQQLIAEQAPEIYTQMLRAAGAVQSADLSGEGAVGSGVYDEGIDPMDQPGNYGIDRANLTWGEEDH